MRVVVRGMGDSKSDSKSDGKSDSEIGDAPLAS
jgi:hypothetical protein